MVEVAQGIITWYTAQSIRIGYRKVTGCVLATGSMIAESKVVAL
jgi:hypothetical protein